MKYDPSNWQTFSANKLFTAPQEFEVRLTEPGALYIKTDGVETLIGYGHTFKITAPDAPFQLKANQSGVATVTKSRATFTHGTPYTNDDRRPMTDPSVAAVTLALRQLKREQKAFAQDQRDAMAAFQKERADAGLQPPLPEPEPEPEPVIEPDPEPAVPPAA